MKPKAYLSLLILIFLSCKTEIKTTNSLLQHLPPNAGLIVKINNLTNFKSELKNNVFLEKTSDFPIHKDLVEKLKGLEYVKTDNSSLLAFFEVGKDNHEFVFISENSIDFYNLEGVNEKAVETLAYQENNILKYSFGDYVVYSLLKNNTIILSSSLMLVENMVRAKYPYPTNETLNRLYNTSEATKSATLFFNLDESSSLVSSQLKEDTNSTKTFSDWVSMDFSANSDNINLNGVAVASDSTKNFTNLFKGTSPLNNKTSLFAPLNAQAIISYTFDDYQVFAKNQNTYLDRAKPIDSLFNTIEEIGLIYFNNQKVVLLSSFGAESLSEQLNTDKIASLTYQGSEIITLKSKNLLAENFKPLVTDFKSSFCTILENTFVFSESKEPLQTIISNYKSSSSFNDSPVFKTATKSLANESSILFVSNASGADFFTQNRFTPSFFNAFKKPDFSGHTFAAQFVADNDFAHANFLISKIEKKAKTNSVAPLFTLELDTDLAMDPQFVKNHRTNKQEIMVQDQNNSLYLISTEGKVLWKKQLNGRVRGPIKQVDIYKNGRLQLAFCTNNQFLILDRNGEEVPPFNKTFEGGNLNSLAVFDYEGNKDYRFIVTQGEKVFMYNNKANIVPGFTYTRAQSPIISAPKHFRVSNKDFLIFQLENMSLKILHRSGGERLKVLQKIDFSDNEVFLYKNKFSTTNKKGILHQIDTKGKLTSTNFNLSNDHGMHTTSKTLVFMDDNILSIKGKKVELDLGVYTKPKIFYIYDKIYVSVTDIQNQKIYLYDSQAKPIPNFPVFGNSLIDMVDMDNDKKLEMVAKDQENSIIVYKMN
ncbi:ribonuclease HII [Flagellimonas pacifica]|uniref:Uncharacterized protein n=1 Tax=Flagellimonas pacifica TaxID=1247520 RepID=A0A285M4W9_9FLAO|nr:ribonuclease HII [Allomuricauda parva]SNY91507.1 hypothetical protein SAMN06265377_0006 [Allomuricauda parva]